jgi:hypothetical protein
MDLSSASAISSYNYQRALKTGSQDTAVLQALTQAYASQNTPLPGDTSAPDSLTQLAGASALGPLVSGIYSVSVASGGSASPVHGMAASLTTVGGVNASSAATLLGEDSSGFSNLNVAASEALAAYRYQQGVLGSTGNASSATYAQQLAQAAQTSSMTTSLNLLT